MSARTADEGREADQALTIAFLMRPDSYPDRPDKVERIDTHGAMIFLAGSRAYKLKRAVKLAYLDFSTMAKRKAVCEREIALNSITAPKLYKGLISVTCRPANSGLQLGGEGEPVDWLIEMERFGQDQLFDRLAVAGRLNAGMIEALAGVIERFHASAAISRDDGWPAALGKVVANIGGALDRWSGASGGGLGLALKGALAAQFDLLVARREGGLVRRCHGDLHLRNIVLVNGKPCLFDALEFDETLARIDVLYDLAFLLMDLCHRGLKSEAHRLLNHYFMRDISELEWRGLSALPFFLSLRAAIRAMVGLDGLSLAKGEKQGSLAKDITDYVDLAAALLTPKPPRLIAIGGLSGTGKSTVARAVGPQIGAAPGAIILRTDSERKLMRGAQLTERLAADAYAPKTRDEVYARVLAKAEAVLKAGHSVILDAVFDAPNHREAAKQIAQTLKVPFSGIWLEAPAEQMMTRVAARSRDASDADATVVRRQIERVVAPEDWQRVDAGGSPEQTADRVCAQLDRQS